MKSLATGKKFEFKNFRPVKTVRTKNIGQSAQIDKIFNILEIHIILRRKKPVNLVKLVTLRKLVHSAKLDKSM